VSECYYLGFDLSLCFLIVEFLWWSECLLLSNDGWMPVQGAKRGKRDSTQFFLFGGDLNKINKFQAAAEHGDARSCALYYASYYASSFVLLAPAV
jgi:hypothetical protein